MSDPDDAVASSKSELLEVTDMGGREGRWFALMGAIHDGDKALARRCVQEGCDLEKRDTQSGYTALLFSLERGDSEIARMLLEANADPTAVTFSGNTTLHLAARAGTKELVEFILDLPVTSDATRPDAPKVTIPVDIENGNGDTPLLFACAACNVETTLALVARGANTGIANSTGTVCLMAVAGCTDSPVEDVTHIAQVLLDDAGDGRSELASMQNVGGDTAAHIACRFGNVALLRTLLHGVDMDLTVTNARGQTIVQIARGLKDKKVRKQLLAELEPLWKVLEDAAAKAAEELLGLTDEGVGGSAKGGGGGGGSGGKKAKKKRKKRRNKQDKRAKAEALARAEAQQREAEEKDGPPTVEVEVKPTDKSPSSGGGTGAADAGAGAGAGAGAAASPPAAGTGPAPGLPGPARSSLVGETPSADTSSCPRPQPQPPAQTAVPSKAISRPPPGYGFGVGGITFRGPLTAPPGLEDPRVHAPTAVGRRPPNVWQVWGASKSVGGVVVEELVASSTPSPSRAAARSPDGSSDGDSDAEAAVLTAALHSQHSTAAVVDLRAKHVIGLHLDELSAGQLEVLQQVLMKTLNNCIEARVRCAER